MKTRLQYGTTFCGSGLKHARPMKRYRQSGLLLQTFITESARNTMLKLQQY